MDTYANQWRMADFDQILREIFNKPSLGLQPDRIIEVDCQDGEHLARAFGVVASQTVRGRNLTEQPLEVVALILDADRLEAVRKQLADIPHRIALIGDTRAHTIVEVLAASGVLNVENALLLNLSSRGLRVIDVLELAKLNSRHGLIDYQDRAPSHEVLLDRAKVGCFPIEGRCFSYSEPGALLAHYEQRPYIIRPATLEEIPDLRSIEASNWPEEIRNSERDIAERITRYPEGQLAIESPEGLKGVIYSQRIASADVLMDVQADRLTALMDPEGHTIQPIAIFVRADKQDSRLGAQLLEFVLHKAAATPGVREVAALTRCDAYPGPQVMSMEAYLEQRNADGDLVDVVPRMHEQHGAHIKGLVPNYRPKDTANNGFGILVVYNLKTRYADMRRGGPRTSPNADSDLTVESITAFVQESVRDIVKGAGSEVEGGAVTGPLMDCGLGSLQLMELGMRLSKKFLIELEPTFFFQHGTVEAVIAFITQKTLWRDKDWFYAIKWRPAPIQQPNPYVHDRLWIVFDDGSDLCGPLCKRLTANYQYCIVVRPGTAFEKVEDSTYKVGPDSYSQLLSALPQLSQLAGVVFLWGYQGICSEPSAKAFEDFHKKNCVALVGLANALAMAKLPDSAKFWVVNRSVLDDGSVDSLVQSPLNALCKVIRAEYPKSRCTHLALDPGVSPEDGSECLCQEIRTPSMDQEISWRNGQRLVTRVEPVKIKNIKTLRLSEQASYLIMGGMRPLGLAAARWYAERGAKHIILLDEAEGNSVTLTEIDALRQSGVNVVTYVVAFDQLPILQLIFEKIETQMPPLKGVMHCAGVADSELLLHTDWERFRNIYRLKVEGAWHLHHLTAKLDLDHFVLYSSVLPDLAPFGKANHVVGNTFLDSLSQYRRAQGLPSLSIRWGPWEMRYVVVEHLIDTTLDTRLRRIGVQDASRILDVLFSFDEAQVIAARVEWQILTNTWMKDNPLVDDMRVSVDLPPQQLPEAGIEEPIAVIGMACRYPGGADTPEKFWQVFKEGRDTISEVPPERWDLSAFYDPDKSAPGKMYTRYGGFIENVALFDPQFFGISPREAVDMDPQQRIALEVSWEAMENAGIVPASLAGSNTAVFMGICFNDYGQLITESGNPEGVDDYYSTGNHYSVLAGRISYFFGLEGPAMAIDTACSSSLVAIDRAVKQLQSRESDLAISGGVNLILVPQSTINFCKSGMLAQDGRCKTFDAAADGYVRSEGCGVVLLKRWSDAQRDGNRILAVIRATAINQDGASAGLTVPNERAQEKLIEDALKRAKLQGSDIDYVEAHGTGTALGDPIEVRAIAATYGARRESPLWLASAKTNIGHTEAAAGVAGLMKCILALQHEQIPTHLHFHQLNPLIPLDENSIQVARDGRVWKRGPRRRIAAVSSFGFSGTNSHAIVEEGPLLKSTEVDSEDHVLLISAKTEPALNDLISAYQAYLANTAHHIADIVYSANFGRTHFEHRVVVRGRTKEELVKKLLNRNFEPSETELPKMAARQWVTLPNYPFQRKHYWVQTHSKRVETIATGEFGRELAASSDKLKTATEYVTKQVKLILDIDPNETIDPTKGFIEMGMDSLMAVKLAENLRRSLGGSVRIKETVVFDYQSVNKLAAYLTSGEIQEVQRSEVSFQNEPIAIIGIACRFPGGVEDPEAFWDFLHNGVDGISEVPRERWDIDAFYDPDPNAPGKMITRKGGFIKDPAFFDAEFFGISPREAEAMDPQQRLLLETTWEGLERAGIAPSSLKDSPTGVFVGACFSDYTQLIESSDFRQFKSHSALGLARNALNGRISYALGLLGPSMTVDTACSSSLVSTHLACQSLQRGECTVAIAAGANLMLSPAPFVMLSKARMLAPDGHCKTFDKSGDGYARGEGVGVIILKRLSDAVRDGDPILAVIRATAVNQDGASGGITVPNGVAQVRLIRQALNQAQFQPTDVSFVEAHGTGTELGDPIEIGAIEDSYGKGRTGDYPLFLGSVKSNIGHLEGAAGIASIIKVVLALTHGILPPNIGPKELNPKIHLDRIPARVVMEPTPWTGLRRAGVSSFGFTGTNAHAIIEEAPVPQQVEPDQRQFFILALSARSKEALEALLEKYGKFIENTKLTLADICYTANVGRNHFRHRVAIVANSVDGLLSKLRKKEFIRGEANGTEAFEINGKSPEEVAAAYVNGALIDWLSYGPRRQKVVLPTYPFQQKRYWAEVSPAQPGADLQPEPPVVVAGELSVALQDAQDKKRIITEHIVKYLKVILKLPEEHRLDVKQGFFEMGMDSLMAVEIVNMLQRSVGDRCAIDHTSAFDCPNIERLTAYMVKLLGYDEKTVQADPIQAEVSKMSLDELLGELGERNDD